MSATTLDRPDTAEEIYHLTDADFESFFSFETPHELACQRRDRRCDRRAVLKTWWGADKTMPEHAQDACRSTLEMCQECFEEFSNPNGLIACAECEKGGHLKFKRIVYSESLR